MITHSDFKSIFSYSVAINFFDTRKEENNRRKKTKQFY